MGAGVDDPVHVEVQVVELHLIGVRLGGVHWRPHAVNIRRLEKARDVGEDEKWVSKRPSGSMIQKKKTSSFFLSYPLLDAFDNDGRILPGQPPEECRDSHGDQGRRIISEELRMSNPNAHLHKSTQRNLGDAVANHGELSVAELVFVYTYFCPNQSCYSAIFFSSPSVSFSVP